MLYRILFAWVIFGLISLSGCASGYTEAYSSNPLLPPERISEIRASPPPARPIVERSSLNEDVQNSYERRGYVWIGSSSFSSGIKESEESAVKQGIAVGADLVFIMEPTHAGTVNIALPLTTPTTATSYSSVAATAYGRDGPISITGSGRTTTYGTSTTYVPLRVDRSNYAAIYFIKQRKMTFGVFVRELTDEERKRIQSNRGVVIRNVVDLSPAFNADILVDDIIVAINESPVANEDDLSRVLVQHRGEEIVASLIRGTSKLKKVVALNP